MPCRTNDEIRRSKKLENGRMRVKTHLGTHTCGLPAYERGGMHIAAYDADFLYGDYPHMRLKTLAVAPIRGVQVCDERKKTKNAC